MRLHEGQLKRYRIRMQEIKPHLRDASFVSVLDDFFVCEVFGMELIKGVHQSVKPFKVMYS